MQHRMRRRNLRLGGHRSSQGTRYHALAIDTMPWLDARSRGPYRSAVRAAAAMLVAGWLYGLAFPPAALRWTAWIALVPVIVFARRRALPRAAALGALFAIAGTVTTVDWLPRTV